MPTIEFDDQFVLEPAAPVRERYDMVAILRRNVANLEIALKQQTERAKAAESELEAVREDNHTMMLEIHNLRIERDALASELAKLREQKPVAWVDADGDYYAGRNYPNAWPTAVPLYVAPIPAPAVPAEWREVMSKLVGIVESSAKFHGCGDVTKQARALLQSADHSELAIEKVAPDCRACANRGRVNGLSQESYCDGCVYQGRSWRKNHFVLAVKRRCEACAILPCSCK